MAGATWQPAALAADPVPLANVDPDGEAEQVIPSLGKVWPAWLIFAGISAAAVWLCGRWLADGELPGSGTASQKPIVSAEATAHGKKERPGPRRARRYGATAETGTAVQDGGTSCCCRRDRTVAGWDSFRLLFLLIGVFWTALFLHNSPYLAPGIGFDCGGHLAYIQHFCGSWSIPLPGEGWQTHHPPLYHFLVARILIAVGCAPIRPAAS